MPRNRTSSLAHPIHFVLAVLGVLSVLFSLFCAGCASTGSARSAADLTNPALGPESSSWLIGPIARIATAEEIRQYLALTDDAQAAAFIDHFWASRNPTSGTANPLRQAFEERAAQADRQLSEAGYRGRHTDRGTVYVLYGRPSQTDHEVSPIPNGPPIEVWSYAATTPAGLDAKRPQTRYRFIKKGDLTVFYVPGQDPRLRNRVDTPPR